MSLRTYANAPATTLASSCSSGATSIILTSVTGLPITYPYILILDKETASEEVVLVTAAGGTTLTVTRGYDSTSAFAHSVGASVVHGISAIDPREANAHVNASSAVHGLAGSVVGTSDSQTITNKTISADNNTLSGIAASSFVLSNGSGNIDGAAAQKVIPSGAVVGTTDSQALTNKTVDFASNTLTGVASTTTAQALTNKDLTSTTNTFPPLGLQGIVTFTASGSFTKASYTGLKAIRVRLVGGGGGGGGGAATGASQCATGGGGGGGGYSERWLAVGSLGASETVTIGAAGSAGGAGASGGGGGTTSFGALLSATGGAGGSAGSAATPPGSGGGAGGAGGTGSTGDINIAGRTGDTGFGLSGGRAVTGGGGSSQLGAGGAMAITGTSTNGNNGTVYGGGGSGGANAQSQSAVGGSAGAAGIVIVELYG